MKILLTGATGYIGQRVLPLLLENGHTVVCCVRNRQRFEQQHSHKNLSSIEVDFENPKEQASLPADIDVVFYLIHSMGSSINKFADAESKSATNFLQLVEPTAAKQIIFLTGIVNEEHLSTHLASRFNVENIIKSGTIPVTVLRAGIIVGSGSASFEIMRDIVEKLPIMVTPRWLNTKCQPIGIRNVVQFLTGVMLNEVTYNQIYDIGGPEILTYKEMLLQFAEVRHLKRHILTLPVMTPRLSSYWLYFITSVSYPLAVNLVDSMKINVICRPNNLAEMIGITTLSYKENVELAFERIEQNMVLSSWKDAYTSSNTNPDFFQHIQIPTHGCFVDKREQSIKSSKTTTVNRIWSIGGDTGWYYANFLWALRGIQDKMNGGVGLRRGRTNINTINSGDALDFWRVLVADREAGRLLLYAEMKLPGEAWLEFKVVDHNGQPYLQQTATFRPHGLKGRIYWYSVLPFHFFIFNGMLKQLTK